MPRPKRSKREQIERYKRKLQDLEKSRVKNKKRRRVIASSDESDESQGENHLQHQRDDRSYSSSDRAQSPIDEVVHDPVLETQTDVHENAHIEAAPQPDVESAQPLLAPPDAPVIPAVPALDQLALAPDNPGPPVSVAPTPDEPTPTITAAPSQPAPPAAAEPALDPSLLAALGESTSDTPEFGPSIHDSLANIWQPLLKKGIANKDTKDKLLKEYLVPSNCKLLQAPKLNAEISAAVSEVVRGRDKKYVGAQQQLGQGISAVNRAMDALLKSDNKIEALKYLSDGCRILSDLHHFFTKDRTKLITPSLDKNFLHVIQDAERDEYLFGSTLSEKIKASKAIEKQGQQIKKNVNAPKASTTNTTSTRTSTSQGNWSGPPRYSSNRGGRGGSRKTNPPPATRRPYINTTASARPPAPSKTRAQAHQQ